MALPVTISGVRFTDFWHRGGPFISSGGDVYVVLLDSTTGFVEVWSASDPTTSFSQAGTSWTAGRTDVLDVFQVGDVLHIAIDQNDVSTFGYRTFTMGTDSWGTARTGPTKANEPNDSNIAVAVRSDGDVIVCYTHDQHTSMGKSYSRLYYTVSTDGGANWSTATRVADYSSTAQVSTSCVGIIMDGSDRAHIVYIEAGFQDLHTRAVLSNDTLASVADIDLIMDEASGGSDEPWLSANVAYGTDLRVVYVDADDTVRWATATAADSPTWSTAQISDSGNTVTNTMDESGGESPALAAGRINSEDHALWVTGRATVKHDKDTGSGWGTDVTEYSGTAPVALYGNTFERDGNFRFAFVVDDNGTIKYDEVDLGAAGAAGGLPFQRPVMAGLIGR